MRVRLSVVIDLRAQLAQLHFVFGGYQYALIIIGVLLVAVMLFFPDGIVVTLACELPKRGWSALAGLRKGKAR